MVEDIKEIIKEVGFKKWQIAKEIGYSDAFFSRILRHSLSKEMKVKVLHAILNLHEKRSEQILNALEELNSMNIEKLVGDEKE